jgi:hypothetical protein
MTDATESREAKFQRLAEARVNRALDAIRLIGNLASSQYAYSPDQVSAIGMALATNLKSTLDKFDSTIKADRPRFSL